MPEQCSEAPAVTLQARVAFEDREWRFYCPDHAVGYSYSHTGFLTHLKTRHQPAPIGERTQVQCMACKKVFPIDQVYACVKRGNPKYFIPWLCVGCHESCEGQHCERHN